MSMVFLSHAKAQRRKAKSGKPFKHLSAEKINQIVDRLLAWMEAQDYRGWDPHDGLNSPFLRPLSRIHRWAGVAGLQAVKRCCVNLRPILRVPKTRNAKGIGLVVAASIRRFRFCGDEADLSRAVSLADWLGQNKTQVKRGFGWGYPFDWPNRAFFGPAGTPTVVNTAFIGHSLLDLFEETGDDRWLALVEGASRFISQDLTRTAGPKGFCFSYTPIDSSQVHNANLLGASLIARLGQKKGDFNLLKTALESTAFSISAQRPDGSWPYGKAKNQAWVDSFHTGYNLLAMKNIAQAAEASGHDDAATVKATLDKGYAYYLDNFFLPDGTVKYYDRKTGPLDAHAFAHALLCLTEMKDHPNTPADMAEKVLQKMIALFWSGQGYFYWQINRSSFYRLACMRWVQAWVLLALSTYLSKTKKDQGLES